MHVTSPPAASPIAAALIAWHARHGRHDLPWQRERTAYRVWVSEIMLQQTQVATVMGYYERFMQRFPDIATLAAAPLDEVLHLWSGLGYYSRARNLHRAAQRLVSEHGGEFPLQIDALAELPGIGRSTAAAILALAFERRATILDGNVKRVLARYFAIEGALGRRRHGTGAVVPGGTMHSAIRRWRIHPGDHGLRCNAVHAPRPAVHALSAARRMHGAAFRSRA